MKLEIEIGGKARTLEFEREGERLRWRVDGHALDADAVEISPGVYSVVLGGRSLEVRVTAGQDELRIQAGGREFAVRVVDPRGWRGKRDRALEAEGRQQVVAPMPGKVVRVLKKPGETVEAGKGVLVMEAMKMQNEIRAPKSGTLERVLVTEGQAVNAGEVLAVIA